MDHEHAAELVAEADARELRGRAERLVELDDLVRDEDMGFSGQAAEWLFDDVKATWLYGYFAGTVVAAYAFCLQQLAGMVRMLPDDPNMPEVAQSVEALAEICELHGAIDVALRAKLTALQDSASVYLSAGLRAYRADLERRVIEAEEFTEEHSLLADARAALQCSIAVLHRR